MGSFIISKRTNGEFQFNLKADNGEIILTSEGYTTKAACTLGIAAVKANSIDDGKYVRQTSSNGKFYFNLKASNGQVIGTSQLYVSAQSRDSGINAVKSNAPSASILD